ncbi:MAG: acetylornithine deacetylase, partial [Acetobacteraceae bacterium]
MTGPTPPTSTASSAEILARLVSFDTTSRNSNLELIGFVRELLDRHAVPYRVSLDPSGTKANVHAVIGPVAPGGIALSGHVDTVPVDGQAWTGDPFTLRRRDGRLYARGACDMKGFVACCLAAVPMLRQRRLARPVHLFISYDEEVGCFGAQRLIEDLDASGLKPSLCIVGEPSGMQPILAHKGKLNVLVQVRGRPGHSSDPAKGVNAVHAAAEAIAYVAAEARRFAADGPFEDGFDPPHTTAHVGTVQGGTILNIIPEHAQFHMEWRNIPADDPMHELDCLRSFVATRIEPAMHAVHPDTGFSYDVRVRMPGLSLAPDHELTSLTKQITGFNSTGKVSYGTEGGFYQNAGIATIV